MNLRRLAAKILFATSSFFLTVLMLEICLSPFVPRPSNLFERDAVRGWKFRSNSEGVLGKVLVRINGKGLRGPELPYERRPGAFRILYLGDSVTLGYGLSSHSVTFPYRVEENLERRTGREIETVNGGINGYCTWQEGNFLTQEGVRYQPDLVVLSFVLNDVTDKSGRYDFGRLQRRRFLPASAFGSRVEFWARDSNIFRFAQNLMGYRRFGKDIERGAKKKERLNVKALVKHPNGPETRKAWEITRQELHETFEYCRAQHQPVLLVVFPFTFQFDGRGKRSGPQQILARYAEEEAVPILDLLPRLKAQMKRTREDPKDYFFDGDHPTVRGSEVVADILADFLLDSGLMPSPSS